MKPLPMVNLLQFDLKVQKEVVKSMPLVQTFDFASCSRRMHLLTKNSLSKLKVNLQVKSNSYFQFAIIGKDKRLAVFCLGDIDNMENPIQGLHTQLQGKDFYIYERTEERCLAVWKDVFGGATLVYQKLTSLFNFLERNIEIYAGKENLCCLSVLQCMKNVKPKLTNCAYLIPETVNSQTYSNCLEAFENLESMEMNLISPRSYKRPRLGLNCKQLIIRNSHWVTVEDLKSMECESIQLSGLVLTPEQLIEFFVSVFNNKSNSQLKFLRLSSVWDWNGDDFLGALTSEKRVYGKKVKEFKKFNLNTCNIGFSPLIMKNNEIGYIRVDTRSAGGEKWKEIIFMKFDNEFYIPFRLLYQTHLSIAQIIKHLDPVEALLLAHCSRRMKNLVQDVTKKRKYNMKIRVGEYFNFVLHHPDPKNDHYAFFRTRPEYYELGRRIELQISYDERMSCKTLFGHKFETFWEDVLDGAKKLYQHLQILFKFEISGIEIEKDTMNVDYETAVDWFLGLKTAKICFHSRRIPDHVYTKILNAKNANECVVRVDPSKHFRLRKHKFTDGIKYWCIEHSEWITLNNLLGMQCIVMLMQSSLLTNRDINFLLRNIINGACPNLELLKFHPRRTIDPLEVFNEIEWVRQDFAIRRMFNKHGHKIQVNGGEDFKLKNGATATLEFFTDHNVITGIQVIVWKETR